MKEASLLLVLAGAENTARRERLANTEVYFRIGANGSYRSMTIVQDQVGIAFGRQKCRQLGDKDQLYDATIQGKTDTSARFRILCRSAADGFSYEEGNDISEATRETRTAAEVVGICAPSLAAENPVPPG